MNIQRTYKYNELFSNCAVSDEVFMYIPEDICVELDLHEGDTVTIDATTNQLVIKKVINNVNQ